MQTHNPFQNSNIYFLQLAESTSELPEPKLNSSNNEQNESSPSPDVEPLKQEINRLKCQLQDAQYKLAQYAFTKDEIMEEMTNASKNLDSPESHIEVDCKSFQESSPRIDIKYSNIGEFTGIRIARVFFFVLNLK